MSQTICKTDNLIPILLRLTKQQMEKLKEKSNRTSNPVSALVRDAVDQYLRGVQ